VGYSMRFFVDGERPSGIAEIAAALKSIDPAFDIRGRDLYRGIERLGQIEIAGHGDSVFGEGIRDLVHHIDTVGGDAAPLVKERLERATATITLELFWGKRGTEPTLDLVAPLWQWLFEHHRGLLQADGEGVYDADRLLLELD
jgi:hypothetical protein